MLVKKVRKILTMKFVKPFDDAPVRVSNAGNQYESVYIQRYDEEGRPYLEEVRKENLVARIRSNKDTVDMNKLIKRFEVTGDMSILQQRKGFYADLEDVPTTIAGMYDLVKRGEQMFDTLPTEVREMYNFNAAEFILDKGERAMKFDNYVKKTESEVKSDDNAE